METLDTQIVGASVNFVDRPLRRPLVLSTGPIEELTEATVEVRAQVGGKEGIGRGSIYLSDLWAWPDPDVPHPKRDALLRRLCEQIAGEIDSLCGPPAHPLELGMRLHNAVCEGSGAPPQPPVLAQAMCLSPFDAAIHDAAGQALGRSAFEFYDGDQRCPAAEPFFEHGSACAAIRRLLRDEPAREFPAWLVVGKQDDMDADVAPWVLGRGYRCLKLKIMGRDNATDVARTVEVFRKVRDWGVEGVRMTVDTNEANPDAASVLDYLEKLQAADDEAFQALQYVEQPTGRDIMKARYDWRDVTRLKPVMLDEGLTSLAMLPEAEAQGWSGLALKTCKGHSFALVAAAWAREHGMLLSLQDLTNPGYSLIHAALFAAHVPAINGVELNSPQFTPAANEAWLPRLAALFEPGDGVHRLPDLAPVGLGSGL